MTAPERRTDAAPRPTRRSALQLWHEAVSIRTDWLAHGLATQPADRIAAEEALTGIYARIGRPRPRFQWVESPIKAVPLITGQPTLDDLYRWIKDPRPQGTPPLASDLVTSVSRLRSSLGEGVEHPDPEMRPARRGKEKEPWPDLPPSEAFSAGVPLSVVLHRGIREAIHASLVTRLALPVRAALEAESPGLPVCWYGQQDASWVAYYDTLARLGLARYAPRAALALEDWATVARSCGWWWPGEQVCVVVDRPAALRTEPVPGAWYGEVRLLPHGVHYRDGTAPSTPGPAPRDAGPGRTPGGRG